MGARRVLPLILSLGLVGCGGTAPSASPNQQAVVATASPALTLTPTATPVAPTARPTPTPTPMPPPTWTKRERAIRDGIRADVRVGCEPRRHDLPPRTIAAVECQPGKDPVSRVGFYLFASAGDALDVYLARIRAEGVALGTNPDDGPDSEGSTTCADNYAPDDIVHCRDREAFFVNSDGYANYRVVIGRLYIGALGTNRDLYDLNEWAWRGSEGDPGDVPPGDMGMVPSYQTLWCAGGRPSAKLPLCKR